MKKDAQLAELLRYYGIEVNDMRIAILKVILAQDGPFKREDIHKQFNTITIGPIEQLLKRLVIRKVIKLVKQERPPNRRGKWPHFYQVVRERVIPFFQD